MLYQDYRYRWDHAYSQDHLCIYPPLSCNAPPFCDTARKRNYRYSGSCNAGVGHDLPAEDPSHGTKTGDALPVLEGTNVIADYIQSVDTVPAFEERVFCLTVADDHTLVANGIFTGQCDGDEDCIMLLLDGLINFSRSFLPRTVEVRWTRRLC